jgi:hypothetical protein
MEMKSELHALAALSPYKEPPVPGCYTAVERDPGTHWIGGLMGTRAGLDAVEKW